MILAVAAFFIPIMVDRSGAHSREWPTLPFSLHGRSCSRSVDRSTVHGRSWSIDRPRSIGAHSREWPTPVRRQPLRSSASDSQFGSMPVSFMSLLQTSLYRKGGRPVGRRPESDRHSFGAHVRAIAIGTGRVYEMHAGGASFLQYCRVGDPVLPLDAENSSEAANAVEAFQAVLLSGVCRPGFTPYTVGY